MQQHLEMVEFGVAGLEDVRTLVKRWKAVLAELARQEAPSMVWQTYRQVGGGSGGPAGRGRRCGLTFLAPKDVLARFIADLRHQGLEVTEDPLVPGVLLTCRLKPRNLQ